MLWVALAGPGANLFLAVMSALLLHGVYFIDAGTSFDLSAVTKPVSLMAAFSLYINVILTVFNLIPVPPLDGGRVLASLLPPRQAALMARIEPFGFLIVVGLIFFTSVWQLVLGPLIFAIVNLCAGMQATVVHDVIQFLFSH
jgi:Zn-dependent protease